MTFDKGVMMGLGRVLKQVNFTKVAAEGHPLLERVMRNESWTGCNYVSPCCDGPPLGRSISYSSALGNKQPELRWITSRHTDYERAHVFPGLEGTMANCKYAARVLGDRLSRALYVATKCRNFDGSMGEDNVLDPLSDWVPQFGPPPKGDNWRGIDRAVDTLRLAGQRLNASGVPASEAFIQATMLGLREGSEEDEPMYMNPLTHCRLNKADRRASMVLDHSCPEDTIWRLPDGCLEVVSTNGAPHLLEFDDNAIVRNNGDATPEASFGFYGNTVMKNLAKVVRIMNLSLPDVKPAATWYITGNTAIPAQSSYDAMLTLKEPTSDVYEATVLSYGHMPAIRPEVTVGEKPCPNPTCQKMNDIGKTACWMCECAL